MEADDDSEDGPASERMRVALMKSRQCSGGKDNGSDDDSDDSDAGLDTFARQKKKFQTPDNWDGSTSIERGQCAAVETKAEAKMPQIPYAVLSGEACAGECAAPESYATNCVP